MKQASELPCFRPTRPEGKPGIVREWIEALHPRMQGTLLTAVRGCDTVERDDNCKTVSRLLRGVMLYANDQQPSSFMYFINWYNAAEVNRLHDEVFRPLIESHDHLPHHFLMHLVHASEIVGEKHPDFVCRMFWSKVYHDFVDKFHMNPETGEQLDARLMADEATFKARQ